MAMRTDERQRFRKELEALGYHHEYIDTWQPHVAMWWHKPQLNIEGIIVKPVGSPSPPQPGHPDTQLRLSSRGLLPWRPTPTCMCSYCQARDWDAPIQEPNEKFDIATFPLLESLLVHEPGRGMVLPPLHGVEAVKGHAMSASELMQKTRQDSVVQEHQVIPPPPIESVPVDKYACADCGFVANGERPTARSSSLRAHRNKEHPEPVIA